LLSDQSTSTDAMAASPEPAAYAVEIEAERPLRQVGAAPQTLSLAIVGLGYVGLPTALAARVNGTRIIGIDVSPARLKAIAELDVDLIPADQQRLAEAVTDEAFLLTHDAARLAEADAVMICVPTPLDEHRNPDLGALHAACAAVVQHARAGQILILTSTSYPGSTRAMLAEPLQARGFIPGEDIYVASSPERIDPGNEVFPQGSVARVVGGITHECTRRAADVLNRVSGAVHSVSSPEAAEMTKLLENSFRAVNIAFANEVADMCSAMGLNVAEVIDAAATKPYGFMPFYPGTGVGGHCIPCDPHYLLWQLRTERRTAPLLAQAMDAIAARPREVVDELSRVMSAAGRGLRGARLLVVGVAYKPGVRDVRESPGIEIVVELLERRARIDYYDPLIPSIRIDEHQVMLSVAEPDPERYDAVLVNVLHPGVDYDWLTRAAAVIDPSGRHRHARRLTSHESADGELEVQLRHRPEEDVTSERRVAEEPRAYTVGG
jgi:nucleotide sugar dehydrogenase